MISEGRLAAKLDQCDGCLHFSDDADALCRWDVDITRVCQGVNACYDRITKTVEDSENKM